MQPGSTVSPLSSLSGAGRQEPVLGVGAGPRPLGTGSEAGEQALTPTQTAAPRRQSCRPRGDVAKNEEVSHC